MEIRDGFIVGVFNYCDGWCEQCALTPYCRVFADSAEWDAGTDPSMKDLVEAPPLPGEEPPGASRWMTEIIDVANEACGAHASAYAEKPALPAHRALDTLAKAYAQRGIEWLHSQPEAMLRRHPDDPLSIVRYFCHFIAGKVHRAIVGLANRDDGGGNPADHDGSAKAALLAVERSQAAWRALVDRRQVAASTAAPFIADLDWLHREIEAVFPNCRSFIRPGFDEPDEVARLIAADRA